MCASQRVYIHTSDVGALANIGRTWQDCWNGLLEMRRCFCSPVDVVSGWPSGPPIACASYVGLSAGYKAESRAQHLVEQTAVVLSGSECMQWDTVRKAVIVATSHGEAGAISLLAEHKNVTAGSDQPVLSGSVCRAILGEQIGPTACKAIGAPMPTTVVSAACASAAVATAAGRDSIAAGMQDAIAIVAVDSLSRIAYTGFNQIGALSSTSCKPFDRGRDGTTIGEASTAYWLSKSPSNCEDQPIAVLGVGLHCDARHPVEPSALGVVAVVRQALLEAHIAPEELCAVIWHGSGTINNDQAEAEAAKWIFGGSSPPCTATKGAFGHCMGASSSLSILTACSAIETGWLPAAAGLEECAFPWLNMVLRDPRAIKKGPVLVVALGFGGINCALVLGPV